MKLIDILLSLLLVAVVLVDLLAAPYTKVEESFNIQATHDILVYGTPLSNIQQKLSSYDHFTFPGAVPRTFIGPLFLATSSQPAIALLGFQHAQLVVRGLLGLFNALALVFFKTQLHTACGPAASRWYAAFQASQFHIMFYASRTLPNMFAFGLTTFAFGLLLPSNKPVRANGRIRLAIMLFVFSAVIFRSEIALLLATNALWMLITPQISFDRLIPPFVVSFALSVTISVLVDSYFWQKWLWPELWGFYYNVVQGSSSNWGTSPWYYYFVSAMPRLLMLALPFIFVALWSPAYYRIAQRLVIPNVLFVAIYSLQPHKEARFIFYVVPPLTGAAALGAAALTTSTHAKKDSRSNDNTLARSLATAVLIGAILLNSLASTAMVIASSLNYPGGEALAALHDLIRAGQDVADDALVTVHADVLSCMTGVTLFGVAGGDNVPTRHNFLADGELVVAGTTGAGDSADGTSTSGGDERASSWLFLDKTEDPAALANPGFWQRFDYLLMEDAEAVRGGRWDTVAVVEGLSGIEVLRPGATPGGSDDELAGAKRVGVAARVAGLRDRVRAVTGGWWVGPRLAPKIRILRRVKDAGSADRGARETVAVA